MRVAEAARVGGARPGTRLAADAGGRPEMRVSVLRLEMRATGLDAARHVYTRHGFVERGPFGDDTQNPHSTFTELGLHERAR